MLIHQLDDLSMKEEIVSVSQTLVLRAKFDQGKALVLLGYERRGDRDKCVIYRKRGG